MNSSDLVEVLAKQAGIAKADARKYLDVVLATVAEAAVRGEEISLSGFGKFKVKAMAARVGRNPADGSRIEIAATSKLGFTPAKVVKERLNP